MGNSNSHSRVSVKKTNTQLQIAPVEQPQIKDVTQTLQLLAQLDSEISDLVRQSNIKIVPQYPNPRSIALLDQNLRSALILNTLDDIRPLIGARNSAGTTGCDPSGGLLDLATKLVYIRKHIHRDIFTTYTSNHYIADPPPPLQETYLAHRDDNQNLDHVYFQRPPIPTKSSTNLLDWHAHLRQMQLEELQHKMRAEQQRNEYRQSRAMYQESRRRSQITSMATQDSSNMDSEEQQMRRAYEIEQVQQQLMFQQRQMEQMEQLQRLQQLAQLEPTDDDDQDTDQYLHPLQHYQKGTSSATASRKPSATRRMRFADQTDTASIHSAVAVIKDSSANQRSLSQRQQQHHNATLDQLAPPSNFFYSPISTHTESFHADIISLTSDKESVVDIGQFPYLKHYTPSGFQVSLSEGEDAGSVGAAASTSNLSLPINQHQNYSKSSLMNIRPEAPIEEESEMEYEEIMVEQPRIIEIVEPEHEEEEEDADISITAITPSKSAVVAAAATTESTDPNFLSVAQQPATQSTRRARSYHIDSYGNASLDGVDSNGDYIEIREIKTTTHSGLFDDTTEDATPLIVQIQQQIKAKKEREEAAAVRREERRLANITAEQSQEAEVPTTTAAAVAPAVAAPHPAEEILTATAVATAAAVPVIVAAQAPSHNRKVSLDKMERTATPQSDHSRHKRSQSQLPSSGESAVPAPEPVSEPASAPAPVPAPVPILAPVVAAPIHKPQLHALGSVVHVPVTILEPVGKTKRKGSTYNSKRTSTVKQQPNTVPYGTTVQRNNSTRNCLVPSGGGGGGFVSFISFGLISSKKKKKRAQQLQQQQQQQDGFLANPYDSIVPTGSPTRKQSKRVRILSGRLSSRRKSGNTASGTKLGPITSPIRTASPVNMAERYIPSRRPSDARVSSDSAPVLLQLQQQHQQQPEAADNEAVLEEASLSEQDLHKQQYQLQSPSPPSQLQSPFHAPASSGYNLNMPLEPVQEVPSILPSPVINGGSTPNLQAALQQNNGSGRNLSNNGDPPSRSSSISSHPRSIRRRGPYRRVVMQTSGASPPLHGSSTSLLRAVMSVPSLRDAADPDAAVSAVLKAAGHDEIYSQGLGRSDLARVNASLEQLHIQQSRGDEADDESDSRPSRPKVQHKPSRSLEYHDAQQGEVYEPQQHKQRPSITSPSSGSARGSSATPTMYTARAGVRSHSRTASGYEDEDDGDYVDIEEERGRDMAKLQEMVRQEERKARKSKRRLEKKRQMEEAQRMREQMLMESVAEESNKNSSYYRLYHGEDDEQPAATSSKRSSKHHRRESEYQNDLLPTSTSATSVTAESGGEGKKKKRSRSKKRLSFMSFRSSTSLKAGEEEEQDEEEHAEEPSQQHKQPNQQLAPAQVQAVTVAASESIPTIASGSTSAPTVMSLPMSKSVSDPTTVSTNASRNISPAQLAMQKQHMPSTLSKSFTEDNLTLQSTAAGSGHDLEQQHPLALPPTASATVSQSTESFETPESTPSPEPKATGVAGAPTPVAFSDAIAAAAESLRRKRVNRSSSSRVLEFDRHEVSGETEHQLPLEPDEAPLILSNEGEWLVLGKRGGGAMSSESDSSPKNVYLQQPQQQHYAESQQSLAAAGKTLDTQFHAQGQEPYYSDEQYEYPDELQPQPHQERAGYYTPEKHLHADHYETEEASLPPIPGSAQERARQEYLEQQAAEAEVEQRERQRQLKQHYDNYIAPQKAIAAATNKGYYEQAPVAATDDEDNDWYDDDEGEIGGAHAVVSGDLPLPVPHYRQEKPQPHQQPQRRSKASVIVRDKDTLHEYEIHDIDEEHVEEHAHERQRLEANLRPILLDDEEDFEDSRATLEQYHTPPVAPIPSSVNASREAVARSATGKSKLGSSSSRPSSARHRSSSHKSHKSISQSDFEPIEPAKPQPQQQRHYEQIREEDDDVIELGYSSAHNGEITAKLDAYLDEIARQQRITDTALLPRKTSKSKSKSSKHKHKRGASVEITGISTSDRASPIGETPRRHHRKNYSEASSYYAENDGGLDQQQRMSFVPAGSRKYSAAEYAGLGYDYNRDGGAVASPRAAVPERDPQHRYIPQQPPRYNSPAASSSAAATGQMTSPKSTSSMSSSERQRQASLRLAKAWEHKRTASSPTSSSAQPLGARGGAEDYNASKGSKNYAYVLGRKDRHESLDSLLSESIEEAMIDLENRSNVSSSLSKLREPRTSQVALVPAAAGSSSSGHRHSHKHSKQQQRRERSESLEGRRGSDFLEKLQQQVEQQIRAQQQAEQLDEQDRAGARHKSSRHRRQYSVQQK